MESSLGFHTMELSLQLTKQQSFSLIQDFTEYGRKIEKISIYQDEGITKIVFCNCDRGIWWRITPKGHFEDSTDILTVKINPKVLGIVLCEEIDYITAATYYDMGTAIPSFDLISKEISPILKTFDYYMVSRVDYCVNFRIDELAHGCPPEIIMNLIKRSNIPHGYEEWKEYDTVAHRMKSVKSSFYLTNRAVNINSYLKYDELLERSQDEHLTVSEHMLEASKSIIRFEVQCKRRKIYDIIKELGVKDNGEINKYENLLQPQVCDEIIRWYFFETVGIGDWYSFAEAVKKIDSYNFNSQKRNRLVEAMRTVSDCRSVHKAKESCPQDDVESFSRTLKELSNLGINQVTIPQKWGIKHIPNLLEAFHQHSLLEQSGLSLEQIKKDDPKTFKQLMRGKY